MKSKIIFDTFSRGALCEHTDAKMRNFDACPSLVRTQQEILWRIHRQASAPVDNVSYKQQKQKLRKRTHKDSKCQDCFFTNTSGESHGALFMCRRQSPENDWTLLCRYSPEFMSENGLSESLLLSNLSVWTAARYYFTMSLVERSILYLIQWTTAPVSWLCTRVLLSPFTGWKTTWLC